MSFYRIFFLIGVLFFVVTSVFADNHNTTETEEEPLPLNDPFAGDDAAASTIFSEESEEEAISEIRSLSKFKLSGIFVTKRIKFATLVNDTGEYISLELFEELTDGLELVELNIKEAVFQKNDNTLISINFKNQIREKK